MKAFIDKIVHADALDFLPGLEPSSIDMVLTDPPYFLDGLDDGWDPERVASGRNQYAVTSLPAGMRFDREQGRRFHAWYLEVSGRIMRALKPGGFFFSFASPRLYHRMASAMDDAGFEIRDGFIWLHAQGQPKAMGLGRFIDRMDAPAAEKAGVAKRLAGWKTPQARSCFEPIAVAQRPKEGTYLENAMRHGVSLINVNARQGLEGDMFPSNALSTGTGVGGVDRCFFVGKPTRREKGAGNGHRTVKPLALCEHLVRLVTREGALVLDPFCGSGTTAVACRRTGRRFIGVDKNREYVALSRRRVARARPPARGVRRRRPSRPASSP